MKIRNLLWLFICTIVMMGCDKEKDDGSRSFADVATITGDSINGYFCYLNSGGLAVSHDRWLAGIERGYFTFFYTEDDWTTTDDQMTYINHAHVFPISVYQVLRPISLEEAESRHINDPDSCSVPQLLSIGRGYRGYFNFSTGLSVVNMVNMEKIPVRMNFVYDPAKQTPDTLRLQFCYQPRIPDDWTKNSFDYDAASCDISSLANLVQWKDSVIIVVEAGDKMQHLTKISKQDFLKPARKAE